MSTLDSRWGVIDEHSIAEARGLLGVPLRRDRMRWNDTATADAIRQFVAGVGDNNPLWTDPECARKTKWASLLAPPSFLYAIDATIVAPKLPGVQWIYAGTRWRWYDVIRVEDDIEVEARLTDIEEKTGKRFGLWVLQKGEVVFRRSEGGLLSVAEGRVARTPRRRQQTSDNMRDRGSERNQEQAQSEAGAYEPTLSRLPRRGGEPRLWEQVAVGETLGPIAIPLTLNAIYGWYMGAQGALHYGGAHGDGVRYRRRHDDFEINRKTGAKDSAARGHFSSKEGKDVGMGGTYDVGLQRIAWVIGFLTDWMGDDGHLAEADIDVTAPNLVGDTTYISGEVTNKWVDENSFVSIAVLGRNQKNVITTKGTAIIALPSSENGPVALPLFAGNPDRWTSPNEQKEI